MFRQYCGNAYLEGNLAVGAEPYVRDKQETLKQALMSGSSVQQQQMGSGTTVVGNIATFGTLVSFKENKAELRGKIDTSTPKESKVSVLKRMRDKAAPLLAKHRFSSLHGQQPVVLKETRELMRGFAKEEEIYSSGWDSWHK